MEPNQAMSDTHQALQQALETAHREREALVARLDAVDRLIEDLGTAVGSPSRAARTQPATRKAAGAKKAAAKKKAGGKRAGGKRAGGKRATAKRATSKRTDGKRTAAKRGGRRRQQAGAGRTDRAVEILRDAGQPMSTGEVRARLAEHEPDPSSKLVSAALAYAHRKGWVRKTANGRWTAA